MYRLHAAALDFAGAVRTCRSPRAVLDLLNRKVSVLGPAYPKLQVFMAVRLEEPPDVPEDYAVERNIFMHESMPKRQQLWRQMRARYRENGPSILLRHARNGGGPITFTELTQTTRPRGADRWIFDIFLRFSIRDGLCCSTLPWVIFYWSKEVLKLSQEQRASLEFMATHACRRLNEMRPGKKRNKKKIKLTRREVDVLCHIAEGDTSEQIAERWRIKRTTVDEYAEEATAKLGAKNRTHAVVIAIYLGIIKK
jgi:DNA-binding CsgD family transcriptional regulator